MSSTVIFILYFLDKILQPVDSTSIFLRFTKDFFIGFLLSIIFHSRNNTNLTNTRIVFSFFCFQSWDSFFRNSAQGQGYQPPPSLGGPGKNEVALTSLLPTLRGGIAGVSTLDDKIIEDHLAVQAIIRSYQVNKNLFNACD